MRQFIQKTAPMGLVFFLALLVVVETGLLIGGMIYYDTLSTLEDQAAIMLRTPTAKKEAVVNPVVPTIAAQSGWKTYTDNVGGWQLMYPDTYFKYQGDPKLGFLVSTSAPKGGISPKFFDINDVWLGGSRIDTNLKSLDQYLTSHTDYANLQKVFTTIGGISGLKLTYNIMVGPAESFKPQYISEGLVFKDKSIYSINIASWSKEALDNKQNLFDQILATFRFTK